MARTASRPFARDRPTCFASELKTRPICRMESGGNHRERSARPRYRPRRASRLDASRSYARHFGKALRDPLSRRRVLALRRLDERNVSQWQRRPPKAPHQLRHGDRLTIGHYIIAVALEGEGLAQQEPAARPVAGCTAYQELWTDTGDAAPPVDRNLLKPPSSSAPVRPDFLDWAVDVPGSGEPGFVPGPARAAPSASDSILIGRAVPRPTPPPPEPGPAIPSPRRPCGYRASRAGHGAGRRPRRNETARRHRSSPEATAAGAKRPSPAPEFRARNQPKSRTTTPDFVQLVARGRRHARAGLRAGPRRLAEQLGILDQGWSPRTPGNCSMRAFRRSALPACRRRPRSRRLNNNPLKFSPTTEDALRIMFGPPSASYLDARQALEEAFSDIKEHQVRTYSAMQQALKSLIDDLDPAGHRRGSRRRRLPGVHRLPQRPPWDTYLRALESQDPRPGRGHPRRVHAILRRMRDDAAALRGNDELLATYSIRDYTSFEAGTGRRCLGTARFSGLKACFCGRIICSRTIVMSSICSRNASAASRPYPWGFSAAGDRPGSRPAEQVRGSPRGRHDAGRNAVRYPGRQPDPGADRHSGRRRGPNRLADHAGRGAEHARGRRSPRRQRQPLYPRPPRPSSIRPPRFASRKKSTSPIRGWRLNCARRQSRATSASASRAFSRSATRTSCSTTNSCRRCWSARRIRSSRAGSTASSAGSRPSSKNLRAMPSIRPPAAGCRASTISCCSF